MAADLFGSDIETNGIWDPLNLSADESTLARNRAAELKHGRVAMLAVLGYWLNDLGFAPLFDGKIPSGLKAISQVPVAGWLQIVAAISIIEASIGKQDPSKAPGDLGFGQGFNNFEDDAEAYEELQLKELKNGRLAMMAFIGMLVQETVTGQTVFQQIATGHISPLGDGQGLF